VPWCRQRWHWRKAGARAETALLSAVALGYDVGCRVNFALGAMKFHLAGHSTTARRAVRRGCRSGPRWRGSTPGGCAGCCPTRRSRPPAYRAGCAIPGHIEKAFDFGGMPAKNGVSAALMVGSGMSGVEDVFFRGAQLPVRFRCRTRRGRTRARPGKRL